MKHVLILALLSVTALGTTGCNSKKRPMVKMEKTLRQVTLGKASSTTDMANFENACELMTGILGNLKNEGNPTLIAYTSDMQVGGPEDITAQGSNFIFRGQGDVTVDAKYFLSNKSRWPRVLQDEEIRQSPLRQWLAPEFDEKCSRVFFPSLAQGSPAAHFVIYKNSGKRHLWAKNSATGQRLRIDLSSADRLVITLVSEIADQPLCNHAEATLEKVSYTLAWGQGLDAVIVSKQLALIFQTYLNGPAELDESKDLSKSGTVSFSVPTYQHIERQINAIQWDKQLCQ